MKALFLFLAFVLIILGLKAQQLPQISQFQLSKYIINPAVAGSNDYFDVKTLNRYQWVGITDAPRTFNLSVNGPLKNPKIGLGGNLFTDNVGPTRRTGVQFSYAYHLNINETTKLGLGVSMGLLQWTIDGDKITLNDQSDPALYSELRSQVVFDAKFGAYLYTETYYVGITAPQLLQNQIKLYDTDNQDSRLEDHYVLMAGYTYELNTDIKIEPAALFKYVSPAPLKYDLSLRVIYQDMIWLGGSYRNNDASVAMVGYQWNEALTIGYAFDFTTSNLREYSDGTHELQLGFRFNQ